MEITQIAKGRDSNDDFRETMISLVDLIVIMAVLVFCGGVFSSDFATFGPISPFGSSPFCRSHLI